MLLEFVFNFVTKHVTFNFVTKHVTWALTNAKWLTKNDVLGWLKFEIINNFMWLPTYILRPY